MNVLKKTSLDNGLLEKTQQTDSQIFVAHESVKGKSFMYLFFVV